MTPGGELTLNDLLLQLGLRVGVRDWGAGADNRITAATDPASRQLLTNAINRGRRDLYSRLPEARVFEPMISITLDPDGVAANVVGGDPSKYRIGYSIEGFAGGQFEWYTTVGGVVTGWGGIIRQCHQSDITALHSATSTAHLKSWPQAVALARQTLANAADPGRKVVDYLWVYPKPDAAYVIQGQVRIGYGDLVEQDDLEPMGQAHLESVLTFAEKAWHSGTDDQTLWQTLLARCEQAVAVSRELDNARGPQNLGAGFDPDAERDRMKYRYGRVYPERWAMVTEASGVNVT